MKKKKYKKIFLFIAGVFLLFNYETGAQNKLTLEDAIRSSLEKNYSIIITKTNQEILENNVTLGNAGLLPNINANASYTKNNLNTREEFSDGSVSSWNNGGSYYLNSTVELNWTIFDGFKMFASLSKYKELKKSGELRLKSQIENTASGVTTDYYNIVKELIYLEVLKQNLQLSQERLGIVNNKKDLGSASKFDVLQAQVDYNEDKSLLLNEENKISSLKINFNQLMGTPGNNDFIPEDTIIYNPDLKLSDLSDLLLTNNKDLMLAKQDINLADIDISLSKSNLYPSIAISGGYGYNKTESDISTTQLIRNYGFNYGVTASYPIFNGSNISRQIENAKISHEISQLEYKDLKDKIGSQLLNNYNTYRNSLELVKLESSNIATALENVNIAKEKLNLGTITPLEFRTIQKNYLDALNRLVSAQYVVKVSETEMLRLTGQIIR